VPATRRAVFEKIKHLKAAKCPFANLSGTLGWPLGSRSYRREDERVRLAPMPDSA
jgi:hypothetical protein